MGWSSDPARRTCSHAMNFGNYQYFQETFVWAGFSMFLLYRIRLRRGQRLWNMNDKTKLTEFSWPLSVLHGANATNLHNFRNTFVVVAIRVSSSCHSFHPSSWLAVRAHGRDSIRTTERDSLRYRAHRIRHKYRRIISEPVFFWQEYRTMDSCNESELHFNNPIITN